MSRRTKHAGRNGCKREKQANLQRSPLCGVGLATIAALGLLALTPAASGQTYVKWDQPPDPAQPRDVYYGWNEQSAYGGEQIAADDWVCETFDPVSDVHWWGSFVGWNYPTPPGIMPTSFRITIWTDVPAGGTNEFSHPGGVIWEYACFDYTWEFVGWDFDPRRGVYEACFLFHCDIPEGNWFYQDPAGDPTVYWVSIASHYDFAPPDYPWGWKTRPRDTSSPAPDAAVRIFNPTAPSVGDLWREGEPIRWPSDSPEDDWDLAFYLTSKRAIFGFKWQQPPVFNPDFPDCFWGWDEYSEYFFGPIIADDYVCLDDRPITDVHWWGSYRLWEPPEPPPIRPCCFHIGIWTDVPAGDPTNPFDFSHPGVLLWEWWAMYEEVMEIPVGCDFHPDWMPFPETCFYYTFNIPEPLWFYQEPSGEPTIYWISIAAAYDQPPMENPWGWKTRPRNPASPAPDDAVRIFEPIAPVPGMEFMFGDPIWWPTPEESWDMAFELTTVEYAEFVKWYQPPEPYVPEDAFNGWNELSVYFGPQIVADDWVCENEDPISDVHWWGSFLGWASPDPPELPSHFHINIWTDVPGDPSHPGTCIWEYLCYNYRLRFAGWDFDPREPFAPPEACFYFECDIPEDMWFYQEIGPITTIYWVSISACYDFPPIHPFGWKTRPRDPGSLAPDDAVRIFDPTAPLPGMDFIAGDPIWWPTPEDSWDMAFRLRATHEEEPGLEPKWAQDPQPPGQGFDAESNLWWPGGEPGFKWRQPPVYNPDSPEPDCFWGWDDISNYFWGPIDADDWVCVGALPVTDVHWWGSYWFWDQPFPPPMPPRAFHIGVWTDVPADDPANPEDFSHPGVMIWEWWVPYEEAMETPVGCDFHPDLMPFPETCFYYTFNIPEPQWFYQEPMGDPTIYWLSIAAVYEDQPTDNPWGWKTRPRDPESPAPDDAVRIFDPVAPAPGMPYMVGEPIWWPTPEESWDLAFELTTNVPSQEVNKVVADDFISDGRDILGVRWWGSYYDERYHPLYPPVPPHVIDGWLIGVHWAKDYVPSCPPDLLAGDPPPTVLAVYFAPADAVRIDCIFGVDCLGHPICTYYVDLGDCCLVCAHPDPRLGAAYPYPPGSPGAFQEVEEMRYWLSVQAVTGMEWIPPECQPVPTGSIPPLEPGSTGAFWGWHTGYEPPDWPGRLDEACVGRIVDFTPYPPACWDYGDWVIQPWLCPEEPQPVNMAFHLLASDCPEDLNGDRMINLPDLAMLLSGYGACYGQAAYLPAADFDNNGCIGLTDLARLLSVYGQSCPTR